MLAFPSHIHKRIALCDRGSILNKHKYHVQCIHRVCVLHMACIALHIDVACVKGTTVRTQGERRRGESWRDWWNQYSLKQKNVGRSEKYNFIEYLWAPRPLPRTTYVLYTVVIWICKNSPIKLSPTLFGAETLLNVSIGCFACCVCDM